MAKGRKKAQSLLPKLVVQKAPKLGADNPMERYTDRFHGRETPMERIRRGV